MTMIMNYQIMNITIFNLQKCFNLQILLIIKHLYKRAQIWNFELE